VKKTLNLFIYLEDAKDSTFVVDQLQKLAPPGTLLKASEKRAVNAKWGVIAVRLEFPNLGDAGKFADQTTAWANDTGKKLELGIHAEDYSD